VRTIKSSREIDSLFRESRRISTSLITALIKITPEGRGQDGRVAFIAGKRMGNAPTRNRAKRVMRETVRRAGGPWPGVDVVLISNARTGSAKPRSLDAAVASLVERAGINS
jgi:ribonuclease P protein component